MGQDDLTCASPIGDIDLAALMLDGIIVAKRAVIVALGIDVHGAKHALGLWVGSTDNKTVCISLLQDLLGRGLREGKLLCVIDGSKGLRAALDDVFGDGLVAREQRRARCRRQLEGGTRDGASPSSKTPIAEGLL